MKLYVWTLAPNPRRVLIFLGEKSIPMTVEDVGDGARLKPEFLARSVHRRVPLLELDDGSLLGEAAAICRYLEALYPNPPLMFGNTPKQAALIDMWERKSEGEGVFAVAEVFRNKLSAFEGRALGGYRTELPQIPALVDRGKRRFQEFVETLEQQLAEQLFVAGDSFSMADITALCAIDFAKRSRMPLPENCVNVARWHAQVSSRPSVAGCAG
jgi:glutathione S-transferase